MRRWSVDAVGALLAVVALAACDAPRLDVELAIPDAYRDVIDRVALRVFAPGEAAPFGCDDLALGQVDAAVLGAATVFEAATEPGGAVALEGVPRQGVKLFLATGLAGELAVVAGCAELGDVDGDVRVAIEAEPTKIVVAPDSALAQPLPDALRVTVTDVFGAPLAATPLAWVVSGPAGERLPGEAITDGAGAAAVAPAQPTLAGPQVLELLVRFAAAPPPPVRGFRALPERFRVALADAPELVPPDGLMVAGAIGPAGEPGFASLAPSDLASPRPVVVAWYDAGAGALVTATSEPIAARALGLVRRGGRDVIMTINAGGWLEVEPDGAVVPRGDLAIDAPALAARIAPGGGCGDGEDNEAILVDLGDAVRAFTADGAPVALPGVAAVDGARLLTAGCAAVSDGEVVRVAAFSVLVAGAATPVLATLLDGGRFGPLAALVRGIGFAPALGGAAPALLATRIEVDGTRIGRYRLAVKDDSLLDTELLTEDAIASVSLSTAGGDVDGDGVVDVAAAIGLGGDSLIETRLHLALGAPVAGGRLDGLSGASTSLEPRLALLDLDGDGLDEIVVGTAREIVVFGLVD